MTANQKQSWQLGFNLISPVAAFIGAWMLLNERVTRLEVQVGDLKEDVKEIKADVKELLKSQQYEKSISNWPGNNQSGYTRSNANN